MPKSRSRESWKVALFAPVLALVALAGSAGAEGLDLADPTPRMVLVRFEASGPTEPGGLRTKFDAPVEAWFAPGPEAGQAELRIPGAVMEGVITSYEPVPGSFSDYVWIFDVSTGHVVRAVLDGVVNSKVDWGFFETEVETSISMDLDTRRRAGFLAPEERFGHTIFEFCEGDRSECQSVPPSALEVGTGYVNAVGPVTATAIGGLSTQSFSPMGEVMIEEAEPMPTVSAGP